MYGRASSSNKFRWLRFKICCCSVRLNPVVTLFSALIIWSFVIWCIIQAQAANEELEKWRGWITLKCTWLYIGTQDIWALFIVVLYVSKYSKFKLGKPNEKPEFNDATYFTMLFAAGIGIGLFYFGVGNGAVFLYNTCKWSNNTIGISLSDSVTISNRRVLILLLAGGQNSTDSQGRMNIAVR